MPLPFILAGAAVVAAGYGAKKGYDGHVTKSEADDIILTTKMKVEDAQEKLDVAEKQSTRALELLGKLQLKIGADFGEFDRIAKTLLEKIEGSATAIEIKNSLPKHELAKIERVAFSTAAFATKLAGGAAGGAAAAYAVYGGVMMLGAASTGTSITALSGVAAYNATMAAIGGGALSAGGLGMAGGTMVLGATVAAPVLAIAGWAYNSYAEDAMSKALEAKEEAKQAIEKMEKGIVHLKRTREYANEVKDSLVDIYITFEGYFEILKDVDTQIKEGTDVNELSDELITAIENGYGLAAILADIISTPLFVMKQDNDGQLSYDDNNMPEFETDAEGHRLINEETIDEVIAISEDKHQEFE